MSTSKPTIREPLNTRQRTILITFYNQNPYPSASERYQLAQSTGRTLKQIQDWFSNRRRNDSKLASGKTVSVAMPPLPVQPSTSMQAVYYYPPPPSICPCCFSNSAAPLLDPQSFYPPCSTYYYSPSDAFH
ncbi:unnamed protein product [Adineta ricciae]|uniref:Homeobox domain-containing protein n=1 Tax=Adineta ricciae TaxID=249248 RepID=A0A813YCI8_ADIRI|nr:unnamed protein product [Adineta ricciae]